MLRLLQPFIVTSWHGHRDDPDIPPAVQSVWGDKFRGRRGPGPLLAPGPGHRKQSNVDIALLTPEGSVAHAFDAFVPQSMGSLGRYTAREVQRALPLLELANESAEQRPVRLPDLDSERGIRLLVRLQEDRMVAYRAPVMEVVPLAQADWQTLAWPAEERVVQASSLKPWLSQIYPPGIMERTDQRTKVVYAINSTEGGLKLRPVASKGKPRQAILSGTVRLTDEGPDGFSYQGKVEIVLTYPENGTTPGSLRGYFDGIYPRHDPRHGDTRKLVLQAAIESLPE